MPGNGKDDGRTTRWAAHRDQRRAELVLAAVARSTGTARTRASPTSRPRPGSASRCSTATSPTRTSCTPPSASGAPERCCPGWSRRSARPRPCGERIAEATDAYLATLEEHPQVFLLLVRHRGADALADGKAEIAAAFARFLGDTLRDLGIDAAGAEPWSHGLVGLGLSTGEWWLERRTMSARPWRSTSPRSSGTRSTAPPPISAYPSPPSTTRAPPPSSGGDPDPAEEVMTHEPGVEYDGQVELLDGDRTVGAVATCAASSSRSTASSTGTAGSRRRRRSTPSAPAAPSPCAPSTARPSAASRTSTRGAAPDHRHRTAPVLIHRFPM